MAFNEHALQRHGPGLKLSDKIWQINWPMILLIGLIALVGFAMLYSAAGGDWQPWAARQAMRFGVGLALLLTVALVDIRIWFRWAYLLYAGVVVLLIAVEIMGSIGMGAQRWIDLKIIQIQPSELMKIAIVLALARYYHGLPQEEVTRPSRVLAPVLMVLAPAALVLKQPDLGTAAMLIMVGGALLFIAGVALWKFVIVLVAGLSAIPIAWNALHDYQRQRVLTFLDPETDPLGSGYHILQSKIALGSGGLLGKGFLGGTQSHLNFLPEMQTDFIFTVLAEEFGLAGGLLLIGLYTLLFVYGFAIGFRARNLFARLLALGLTCNLFLYVFINIAMVMGLIPVVGVPLPLISYGGTALLAVMTGLGLLMSCYVHRDVRIPRRGLAED